MKKRFRLPNPEAHKKLVGTICDNANIQVRFVPGLGVPFASIDRKGNATISLREPLATDLISVMLWDWDAHHETSHLFPELRFCFEALGMLQTELERNILNVLADNICEKARHGRWAGRDRILYDGRRTFTVENSDKVMIRNHPSISALYMWDIRDRCKWQGSYPLLDGMPGADDYYKEFQKLDISERVQEIMEVQDPSDLAWLVKQIAEIAKAKPPEEDNDNSDDADEHDVSSDDANDDSAGDVGTMEDESSSTDEPDDSSGTGDDDADSPDSDIDNSDDNGSVTPSGGGSPDDDAEEDNDADSVGGNPSDEADQDPDNTSDSSSMSGDDADSGSDNDEPDNGSGSTGEPSDTNEPESGIDEDQKDTPDDIRPFNLDRPDGSHSTDGGYYIPVGKNRVVTLLDRKGPYYKQISEMASGCSISKQVQRYFKIMSKDSFQYGMSRGKIHGKNLHRLYIGSDNPKVFKQKNIHRLKTDTAVTIMIDCSCSMTFNEGNGQPHKYPVAAASVAVISETLSDLRIPHEILGFTEYRRIITFPFKLFHESVAKTRLIDRLGSISERDMHYTADAEAIVIGANRLAQRKEPNKLMIVLSDGKPEGTFKGDGHWYLRKVCKMIEESDMNLIGIGIKTAVVKQFYANAEVVNDISELEKVLIEALKRNLI